MRDSFKLSSLTYPVSVPVFDCTVQSAATAPEANGELRIEEPKRIDSVEELNP